MVPNVTHPGRGRSKRFTSRSLDMKTYHETVTTRYECFTQ